MDNAFEKAIENMKLEMTLQIINAVMGDEKLPDEIATFLRILVQHGCPADVALESLSEFSKEMNEKERASYE